nr:hypothetical protein [Tanacetum cinerariifolium]
MIIHHFLIQDKTLSWRNKIRMHTSKDDYLINTLRFVSRKEASQKYGAVLPKCLTSPQMKESKAYKTYLGYTTGTVPPKVSKKFKKASPSKKDSVPEPADEEPVQKGKRVKRSAKKYSTIPTTCIVIREPPVETQSKRKEKMKEVRKKSLRDFYKSHPSGSGLVAKKPPSVEKITPSVTSKGTGDKLGVPDENNSEEHESDSEQDTDRSESDFEFDQQVDDDDEDDDNDDDKSKEITQEQVVEDAYVTITKKTEVPVTSSSRSYDLASKFLNFLAIPPADKEIVSPLDVHVHHEVPRIHTSTLIVVPVSVIPEASHVYMNIPQSSQISTSPPLQSTPSPLPTTETTNIPSSILDFTLVFRFNDRVIALEKEVAKIKNDPLHNQVIALVDDHLDTRMGATREEFMNFLSASLTDRIIEQVRNQMPQILPEEVSNFASLAIKKMIQELLNQVNLAMTSSQPQSTYEAAPTLTEFELKKILIDKMNSSESYLTAPEHQECYDGLIKSYNLYKDFFSSYDVYSLKCSRDEKDKDEGPSAGSDRGLKKRNTSKDAEPTTSLKTKDSSSRSSKGTKSQPKSVGKSVHVEEPEFEVGDTNTPQGQEGNQGNDNDEPRIESDKTPQKGPIQNWLKTLVASTSIGKSLKEFDELMSTPIDFSSYILNGLKIENLTQEILLGPAFRLLKGTHLNYAELEYDFQEFYKALLEKLDWENPEGDDYPFDLSKPLPLITHGNHQSVPVKFFINNDLKYLQRGILTMTYTTSTTKTKATQYDLPGIKDMVPNIWSPVKVAYDKYALWVTRVSVMRKHRYGYLEEIVVRRADNALYKFKEGDFLRLRINDIEDKLLIVVHNWLINILWDDVADFVIALRMFTRSLRNRLMRSDELYKFSDGTLTRLLSSLEDITKNIKIEYLLKRRWSTLEKKRAYYMIKDINKLLKERRMMRSLEKFVSGRLYGTDLGLLQRTI